MCQQLKPLPQLAEERREQLPHLPPLVPLPPLLRDSVLYEDCSGTLEIGTMEE